MKQTWSPYKCIDGCLNVTKTIQNQTIEEIDGVVYVCNLTMVEPETGMYYCNNTHGVIFGKCNNTCPELIVNDPLQIVGKPSLILEKFVPVGGEYHIYCPAGQHYSETNTTGRKYKCETDNKYSTYAKSGLLEAENTCVDVGVQNFFSNNFSDSWTAWQLHSDYKSKRRSH